MVGGMASMDEQEVKQQPGIEPVLYSSLCAVHWEKKTTLLHQHTEGRGGQWRAEQTGFRNIQRRNSISALC